MTSHTLDQRVRRILGQLKGIQKMVDEKRDPIEILQQISAVKKAINGFSREIVFSYFSDKLPDERLKEVETMLKRMIDL